VHSPGSKTNFVGMLLVKQLIKYDPEDAEPVSSFQISTLPETGPDTSSHMALVSNDPGGETGVLGVITLEDVIEELIGEVT
jgi:CBS domain containing-hemolysin-like protein